MRADRGDGLGLGEPLGVADRSILNSPVAVMDQAGDVVTGPLAGPEPHVEGVECEIGAQAGRDLPAHDHPAEHVEDERDVGPAGVRADIGQIGDPQLVRPGRGERAIHQVFGPLGLSAVADRGLAGLLPRDPAQALGAHEPLHGAAGHLDALAVELGVDLPGTVDTEVRLVSDLDVRRPARRRGPRVPRVAGSWRRSSCSGRSARRRPSAQRRSARPRPRARRPRRGDGRRGRRLPAGGAVELRDAPMSSRELNRCRGGLLGCAEVGAKGREDDVGKAPAQQPQGGYAVLAAGELLVEVGRGRARRRGPGSPRSCAGRS